MVLGPRSTRYVASWRGVSRWCPGVVSGFVSPRDRWVARCGSTMCASTSASTSGPLLLPGRHPGDLEELVAELVSSPLDRSRPLWEVWAVDGLAEDRWAIIAKVHHCMVDGIAGNDLLSAILAHQPDADSAVPDVWVPSPEPSAVAFAWFNVRAALGSLAAHVRGAAEVLGHPSRSWERRRNVLVAAKRLWYRQHHDPTSLTGPIGTHRRWTHIAVPFADVSAIRHGVGWHGERRRPRCGVERIPRPARRAWRARRGSHDHRDGPGLAPRAHRTGGDRQPRRQRPRPATDGPH